MKKNVRMLCIFLLASAFIFSCKKADEDHIHEPDATTFNFNLTFATGDTVMTYSGITGFSENDVVLLYVYNDQIAGENYYVQLPYTAMNLVNIYGQFSSTTGKVYVHTEKADGTAGSPWTSSHTFAFKAVLISSKSMFLNQDVDYSNYLEVKKRFRLTDE